MAGELRSRCAGWLRVAVGLSCVLGGLGLEPLEADVKLPAVFSDGMVLQADQPARVWGWAEPGSTVAVRYEPAEDGESGQSLAVQADSDAGRFEASLSRRSAGEAGRLIFEQGNRVEVKDVLFGEVWIASGQSNMAMTVSAARDGQREAEGSSDPLLRMFTVARSAAQEPQDDCRGTWKAASPADTGSFSATAYYFARHLRRTLGVPVGIVHASWGGTAVEAWTSTPALKATDAGRVLIGEWEDRAAAYDPGAAQVKYERQLESWKRRAEAARAAKQRVPRKPTLEANPRSNQNYPGNLFRGMISPVEGYSARGAIWYQGERNSRAHAEFYGTLLETLIGDWRARWDQSEFAFLWVQLPNYQARQTQPSETSGWVWVREGMRQTLKLPQTGMAITTDIGEAKDIHPKNKQDVGHRLALAALGRIYGRDLIASGPLMVRWNLAGTKSAGAIEVTFTDVGEGLRAADGGELQGFAIAGEDQRWHWAEARAEGSKVTVTSAEVPQPVAVRYGWAANPVGNLVNSAGLPASPFRTDDWSK